MQKAPLLYPLTTSQELMFINKKYSFIKSIIDICTMLHFEVEIDANLLLQAISLALHRNRSASIRMHKVGKTVKQYFSEKPPEPVIVMDYSDRTNEVLETDINTWSRTPFPNDSLDVQLYSVRLIKKPNGLYGVYLCVSHLAFDAYSLIMMASEILTLYIKLRDSLPIPRSKSDPLPSFEKEWAYLQSEEHEKDKAFWRDTACATEPLFTSVNGCNSRDHIKGKRYGKVVHLLKVRSRHENYTIPAELVSRVNALAKTLSVSPQCLYFLAARSFLSVRNNDAEDITIFNTIAKRATIVEKKAGGTRVQSIPFRMAFSNSLTVLQACVELHALQRQYYAHANIPTAEILEIYHEKFNVPVMHGYQNVYMTYQPYFITDQKSLPVHLSVYSNGASNMPLYLTIMALNNSGELNCNYDFPYGVTNDDVPRLMHEHMLKVLDAATNNPELTLSELNKLS